MLAILLNIYAIDKMQILTKQESESIHQIAIIIGKQMVKHKY